VNLDGELVLRILIGAALGAVIGYERDLHGRRAGLRTHTLVALASTTFMVVSTHLSYYQHYRPGDLVEIDASRIASSVVSGIGFIAGGAILRNGFSIQGLTTAAGLWLVAAIGLCAGAGMYVESVAATGIGVAGMAAFRRIEDKHDRRARRLLLTLSETAIASDQLLAKLAELDLRPTLEAWNTQAAGTVRHLTIAIRLSGGGGEAQLMAALEAEPGIAEMQLDPPP